jgi:hypothetical protein
MKIIASAILAFTLLFQPVCAATFIARFNGIVTGGTDTSGIFGAPGGNLTGLSYVATFVIDNNVGAAETFSDFSSQIFGGSRYATIFEGVVYGARPSPVSGVLDIGGRTFSFLGGFRGWAYQQTNQQVFAGSVARIVENEFNEPLVRGRTDFQQFFFSVNAPSNPDYRTPLNYVIRIGDNPGGFANIDRTTFNPDGTVKSIERAGLVLTPTSVFVSGANGGNAIPEPSLWLMMIIGFGVVGFRLRSRYLVTIHSDI